MNFETMTLNFSTPLSGSLRSEWVERGLAFEAREEAGECESGLLDLWVLIKGQDLFGMGSLLSAESAAAPGEMAFLRDGWLSYVSIWQRGVEAVNILIGQDRFIVSFISKS